MPLGAACGVCGRLRECNSFLSLLLCPRQRLPKRRDCSGGTRASYPAGPQRASRTVGRGSHPKGPERSREDYPDSPWAGEVQAVLRAGLDLRDRCNAGALSEHGMATARGRLTARLGRLVDAPPPLDAAERFAGHLATEFPAVLFLWDPSLDATTPASQQAVVKAPGPRPLCPARRGLSDQGGVLSLSVDVASAFRDRDAEALTYAAASSAPEAASVSVAASVVTVTPVSAGESVVTVTATDAGGSNRTATQTFTVTVAQDADGDGLIGIHTPAQLDAVRHDPGRRRGADHGGSSGPCGGVRGDGGRDAVLRGRGRPPRVRAARRPGLRHQG